MVMSKKILTEATVRQFMKLAELGALSNKFVSETYEDNDEVVEEEMEEEDAAPEDDLEGLGDEVEDLAPEGEEDLADLGAEEPAEEGGEVDLTPDEAEVLRSILQKLEAAMGDEEAEEEELGDEEAELDMGAEEAPEMEMGGEEELPEEEPAALEEMVNRIAARVAQRILAAQKK
jgi:hypothetical protein